MIRLKHPQSGYVEKIRAGRTVLMSLLFGPLYFAMRGVWGHALVGLCLSWMILPWLVYAFLAPSIIRRHYQRQGWVLVGSRG